MASATREARIHRATNRMRKKRLERGPLYSGLLTPSWTCPCDELLAHAGDRNVSEGLRTTNLIGSRPWESLRGAMTRCSTFTVKRIAKVLAERQQFEVAVFQACQAFKLGVGLQITSPFASYAVSPSAWRVTEVGVRFRLLDGVQRSPRNSPPQLTFPLRRLVARGQGGLTLGPRGG